MPAKIVYERFLWFHKQVKAEKYPNARIKDETTQRVIFPLHLLQYMQEI
jgi:hypothetical protein